MAPLPQLHFPTARGNRDIDVPQMANLQITSAHSSGATVQHIDLCIGKTDTVDNIKPTEYQTTFRVMCTKLNKNNLQNRISRVVKI